VAASAAEADTRALSRDVQTRGGYLPALQLLEQLILVLVDIRRTPRFGARPRVT
jgi:hypothetical protein